MILVRDEIQCEAGQAKTFVERFKETAQGMNGQNVIQRARIMTDLTGRFDTVVVESEVESIDAYFAMLHAAFAARESQGTSTPTAYQTGSRTFYTIEAEYALEQ